MGTLGITANGRTIRQVVVDYLTAAEFGDNPDRHRIESGPTRHGGAWWAIMRTPDGYVYLACLVTSRDREYVYVKAMEAEMGPDYLCPPAMFAEYVRLRPEPGNEYEAGWRARQAEHAPARIRPGDWIRFHHPLRFDDGTVTDRLCWLGRFRFRRPDGVLARMPRDWRTTFEWSAA